MNKLETLWDYIQFLYKKYHNIPPRIVDMMSTINIFELCASGLSNKTISNKLELPEEYIESVLNEFINFPGWKQDLDISPIMVYNSYNGSYAYFRDTIPIVSSVTTRSEINKAYKACRQYDIMRKEIQKYVN